MLKRFSTWMGRCCWYESRISTHRPSKHDHFQHGDMAKQTLEEFLTVVATSLKPQTRLCAK